MSIQELPHQTGLSRSLQWWKPAIQIGILALVSWGIGRTVMDARTTFAEAGFSPAELRPLWLVAAGGFYLIGMLPSCWFWKRTLEAMGQQPGWRETIRAFFIGHLGKYVPGKAMVVVLRTGFIRGPRVDTTVAATSVFVETLTLMAVGASLAALILAFAFQHHTRLLLLAIVLACCAGIPTCPPIFRRLVRRLQVRRANPQIDRAVAGLDLPLMVFGWLMISAGWLLFGLSLWAIIRAIPGAGSIGFFAELPLLTACVSLAMVAGFLSLLPGGVGVREFVVMSLLIPTYGNLVAIVSAVALRVVWLAAEVFMAAALYMARRPVAQAPDE